MAVTQNNLSLTLGGVVQVEHSDERLAAVEEAKRTGQEFQSIGAKGTDFVDRDVLRAEIERVSNEGSTDPNVALPDYLAELKANAPSEEELNELKAREHSEYSEEIVRAQQEAAVSDAEKLRKDPYYFTRRIAENNQKLADDYSKVAAEYARDQLIKNEGVQEEVRALRVESVGDPNPITMLGQKSKITDISEGAATAALELKDRIIYGEESYAANAKADRTVAEEPASEGRAQKASVTNEPERVDEPVRKTRVAKS
jgi:hypothetical protein